MPHLAPALTLLETTVSGQELDSNPLEDLQNSVDISHVMKNGRLYEAGTLNEIWPRQRTLPTQWWWRMEPEGGR